MGAAEEEEGVVPLLALTPDVFAAVCLRMPLHDICALSLAVRVGSYAPRVAGSLSAATSPHYDLHCVVQFSGTYRLLAATALSHPTTHPHFAVPQAPTPEGTCQCHGPAALSTPFHTHSSASCCTQCSQLRELVSDDARLWLPLCEARCEDEVWVCSVYVAVMCREARCGAKS